MQSSEYLDVGRVEIGLRDCDAGHGDGNGDADADGNESGSCTQVSLG